MADNIANLSTPGFKRMLNDGAGSQRQQHSLSVCGQPTRLRRSIRRKDRCTRPTIPMDVAITGPGFISVQGPNGTAYTRNGTLAVAA